MVLTVSSALSPVTGLVCHRRRRNCFHRLDTGVGVSGPHGFAVRKISAFVNALLASTASHAPTSVTIAKRPSVWDGMARDMQVIWVRREREYFLLEDWTTQITLIRLDKFAVARKSVETR